MSNNFVCLNSVAGAFLLAYAAAAGINSLGSWRRATHLYTNWESAAKLSAIPITNEFVCLTSGAGAIFLACAAAAGVNSLGSWWCATHL